MKKEGSQTAAPEDHIHALRHGQEEGFNFFFREYYAALCYYSFRITGDKSIAEEIAGEALMKLWERRKNFDNTYSIKSFLYTTIRNASLNALRQQNKADKRNAEFVYLSDQNDKAVTETIIEAEFFREIHLAMKLLPPKCKKIFEMMFLQGMSYTQIAEELQLSVNTIRNQKARGIMLVKQKIALMAALIFLIN